MLTEFKAALEAYVRKRGDLDTVLSHLKAVAQAHPELRSPLGSQLRQLTDARKLSPDAYAAMSSVLEDAETGSSPVSREDTTEMRADLDSTLVEQKDDKTEVAGEHTEVTGENTGSSTGMTGPTQGPVGFVPPKPGASITIGSTIRRRFQLESKLGEGGMGTVYKGKDMIKVEAKDKNPWVAVKVLNESFKHYKEAFIALQRESSKAMRLAHPNIATVFDFDRDYDYDTVFMTMELLEGEPLNKFIRRIPAGGLSYEQAKPYIEGMCRGLGYAHHHNLVHSDFKPGNCFINKAGVLKILDFGIARAAKNQGKAEGETTLFDPGTLGALTPAYASAEMLEGMDPDPNDDIYALGCVTYELLTGKHPFNKMPANQARDNKLKPATVKKLNARQNKALMKSVAFERKNRTATVEEFLDGITPKKPIAQIAGSIAAVMLLIIGALAWPQYQNYLREQENNALVTALADAGKANDESAFKALLEKVAALDERSQQRVLLDAQKEIVGHFEARARRAIDAAEGRYDYPAATAILGEAAKLYPDNAKLASLAEDIADSRSQELGKRQLQFGRMLTIGALLPEEGPDNDVTDVLGIVRQISPRSELLTDPQIAAAYAQASKAAREDRNYARGEALLKQAAQYAPGNVSLANEQDELQAARFSYAQQQKTAELEKKLKSAKLDGIKDYESARDDLAALRQAAPSSPLLAEIQPKLLAALDKELTARSSAPDQAAKLVLHFSRTLEPQAVQTRLKSLALPPAVQQERAQMAQAAASKAEALLAKPDFSPEWSAQLFSLTQEAEALLEDAGKPLRAKGAGMHLKRAAEMRQTKRYAEARLQIAHAGALDGGNGAVAAERAELDKALDAYEQERVRELRAARVKGLKSDLVLKARNEDVKGALEFLEALKVELPPDDSFLREQGPHAIGDAYARMADKQLKAINAKAEFPEQKPGFNEALQLASAGLEIAPGYKALASVRDRVQTALRAAELRHTFRTADALDVAPLSRLLEGIKDADADTHARLRNELTEAVIARVSTLETYDVAKAKQYLEAARRILPGINALAKYEIKTPEPSKHSRGLENAIKGALLTQARSLLDIALREEPKHPDILRLRQVLEEKMALAKAAFEAFRKAEAASNEEEAKKQITLAMGQWKDNADFLAAAKSSAVAIVPSTAPCNAGLAGYGRSPKGVCFDMVSSDRKGPDMVVIPAGSGATKPFAIGKYEVTVGDYNNYCEISKKCSAVGGDAAAPITKLSIQQIEAYVGWLSTKTGAKYRLPTPSEWSHAANADGAQPRGKTWNCTVRLGEQIMKGSGLVSVNAGIANGWGLVNYIGNAQELTGAGGELRARGGAYKDNMSECSMDIDRPHSGSADDTTGFRIAREVS
jgi:serine/threonine protein kinase/formylglycine-generating enzyme required for sulfatase activity